MKEEEKRQRGGKGKIKGGSLPVSGDQLRGKVDTSEEEQAVESWKLIRREGRGQLPLPEEYLGHK